MGSDFVVYTDHKALEHWLRKEPVKDKHAKMLVKLSSESGTSKGKTMSSRTLRLDPQDVKRLLLMRYAVNLMRRSLPQYCVLI